MKQNTLFKPIPAADLEQLLAAALFNPNDPPAEEVVVFRIEMQNIGSLGNFDLLTGLPKAGKGKYICGFIAAGLSRDEIFGMTVRLPPGKDHISYWDTEQSRYDHHQMMKTIRNLMDIEQLPGHFKAYHCRKHDAQTIIPMIQHELATNPNIGVIVLDGLLDLIDSFNDESQSKRLVNFLKEITDVHGIFVMGVLHRSKTADKSMGHLGSAADRAAQSVLIVEKNKELKHYILKAEYLRNADEFTPIAIYYNKQLNLWEQCEHIVEAETKKQGNSPKTRPQDLDISIHSMNVPRIFNSQRLQTYNIFVQNIKEIYGCGTNWAKDCVKFLCFEARLVYKTEDGYTTTQQAKMFIQSSK